MLVCDGLTMLVTGDPAAELDAAVACAAARRRDAMAADDSAVARRLAAWIDARLDERLCLRTDPDPPAVTRLIPVAAWKSTQTDAYPG